MRSRRPSNNPLARTAILAATLAGLFALAMGVAGPAVADTPPQAPAAPERLVTPNDMGTGALLLKSLEAGRYVEAPRLASDFEITVTGAIARTVVTQRFENPSDAWVEGIYVFPLPDDSAVDTLKMIIGDRLIEGQIKEHQEARQIYEEAKREGKKASLIEQTRPNVFTNSVANIGPGETVVVQIEYQQALAPKDSTFRLRVPLVVAPRYSPTPSMQVATFGEDGWSVEDPVPDRADLEAPVLDPAESAPVNPVTLSVDLTAGFPLGDLQSDTHEVDISRAEAGQATVALDGAVQADRDFELSWKPATGTAPQAALLRESRDDGDYLMLMLTPPTAEDTSVEQPPREVIYVIDISGSMAGESIEQARAALALALERLEPEDRFNVIWFNDQYGTFFPAAVEASPANTSKAASMARRLVADGGTEMLAALERSLRDRAPDGYLRQVIFLTDGAIGNEAQLFDAIGARLQDSRLFTVGIGSAPNSFFMSRSAELGRGTFTHIGDLGQVGPRMAALFEKLERPVLTDIKVSWPQDARSVEAWPNPVPDLYAGEPVVVSARMPLAKGTVRIDGLQGTKPWAATMALDAGLEREGVAKLWARAKIRSLEQSKFAAGGRYDNYEAFQKAEEAIDARILETALEHHLVSRLTSLVAVDVTPSRPADAPVVSGKLPLNLPKGWEFDKVFGEGIDRLNVPRDPAAPDMRDAQWTDDGQPMDAQDAAELRVAAGQGGVLAMLSTSPAPTAMADAQGGPLLPQTAVGIERMLLFGLIALTLSMLLFLDLAIVRRLKHRVAAIWQGRRR